MVEEPADRAIGEFIGLGGLFFSSLNSCLPEATAFPKAAISTCGVSEQVNE
jgi:hypothetical protein